MLRQTISQFIPPPYPFPVPYVYQISLAKVETCRNKKAINRYTGGDIRCRTRSRDDRLVVWYVPIDFLSSLHEELCTSSPPRPKLALLRKTCTRKPTNIPIGEAYNAQKKCTMRLEQRIVWVVRQLGSHVVWQKLMCSKAPSRPLPRHGSLT